MVSPFVPLFAITPAIANALMRIEAARAALEHLPMTPVVLASLRASARLYSTHYSTMIEGNRLTQEQVTKVVEEQRHFSGRERDEKEVLGYFAALEKAEHLGLASASITEYTIQLLHALVMGGGRSRVRPTPYRDGQNVIRDSRSRAIVYLPPEAKDVRPLMRQLAAWIHSSEGQGIPCPIRAGIAHYQFATIHPYYDGNGRTGRLLTSLVLHLGGYGLKGLYSLEEYYARDLAAYYGALSVGPSHNYYMGRAQSDITAWVEYFCAGAAESFEKVRQRAATAADAGAADRTALLRQLDPRQRLALELFQQREALTSHDVGLFFKIAQRTARLLLADWVQRGFCIITDPAKKSRKYALAAAFQPLLH